jgi:hypothetical protein
VSASIRNQGTVTYFSFLVQMIFYHFFSPTIKHVLTGRSSFVIKLYNKFIHIKCSSILVTSLDVTQSPLGLEDIELEVAINYIF